MWRNIKNNTVLLFLFKVFILYFCWLPIYFFWLEPKTNLDERLVTHIIKISGSTLRFLGYDVIERTIDYSTYLENPKDPEFQLLIIKGGSDGQQGVWVGDGCNAISLFVLFSIFIIGLPGSVEKKLWFLPVGIFLIHLINIARVCALAFISYKDFNLLNFNHTYTFTIIVYGFIFGLWMLWVNKYSKT